MYFFSTPDIIFLLLYYLSTWSCWLDWCVLTWVWPARSRTGAPWSRGPPGRASLQCWCCRWSEACWPASCSPLQSWGAGIHSPSLSAASPPPSAASWTPASGCLWPRRPGPVGGSGNRAHSSWTRRPWPCPPSQPPDEAKAIRGSHHTEITECDLKLNESIDYNCQAVKMFAQINCFQCGLGSLQDCVWLENKRRMHTALSFVFLP